MPGDPEINGLDAHRDDLLAAPEDMLVAIVYLDVSKVVIDTDSGDHVPTVRIRRIEPLGPINDVSKAVRDAMAKAETARTGRAALPFETVEVGEGKHSDPVPGVDD